ncbi:hypothetical protein POHY109586_24290 [Polaromonas hydrogenivorans]
MPLKTLLRWIRRLSQTASGVASAIDKPVHVPLSVSNKAASTTAQRGISATKRA